MSEQDDIPMSDELQQHVLLALGLGLDGLQKQKTFIPMLISSQDGELTLAALAVEAAELTQTAAEAVAQLPPEARLYALVFDGKMNVDGELINAVIAQAAERGEESGHTVYQPYVAGTFQPVGPPEYAGPAAQFFAT